MRDEIANMVYPVMSYALNLHERVKNGVALDFESQQATLKGLLGNEAAAKQIAEFGGEGGLDRSIYRAPGASSRITTEQFLGTRYALACWLDELFIVDSPWDQQWNEKKLEVALYGSAERAWLFWEQARKAEGRPEGDALEVFFLCVVLGFRGELRGEPDKLQSWAKSSLTQISKRQKRQPPKLPEKGEPTTNVPPLRGREGMQRMMLIAGIEFLLFIPFLAFLIFRQLLN
jgi:type VI secretion system protein ImpK